MPSFCRLELRTMADLLPYKDTVSFFNEILILTYVVL